MSLTCMLKHNRHQNNTETHRERLLNDILSTHTLTHTQKNTNLINKNHGNEFVRKYALFISKHSHCKMEGLLKLAINYWMAPQRRRSLKLYEANVKQTSTTDKWLLGQ